MVEKELDEGSCFQQGWIFKEKYEAFLKMQMKEVDIVTKAKERAGE